MPERAADLDRLLERACPKNIKDKAKWKADHALEVVSKTSLDTMHGWTLCVGLARDDNAPRVLWNEALTADHTMPPTGGEAQLMVDLDNALARHPRHEIVTYNGARFDLPWLKRRALKYRLPNLARRLHQDKPWSKGFVDVHAAFCAPERFISGTTLDEVAAFFGLPSSGDEITGAEVAERYSQGDLESIATHVKSDVTTLRELFIRLREAGIC